MNKVVKIGTCPSKFNDYLPYHIKHAVIYKSTGLEKHIQKRHPDCLPYVALIPEILTSPDYIGVNPNENVISFELVKVLSKNIQLGIKLDTKEDYFYIATLYTITDAKLRHSIKNGRLKKFDK